MGIEVSAPDGRHLRGVTNKAKLLQAALLLIRQGNWRPEIEDITGSAGLSMRTFFTHFRNIDSFYEELYGAHEQSLLHLAQEYSLGDTVQIMLRGRKPT